MLCFVPGRGVCAVEVTETCLRLVVPAGPQSKIFCTRILTKDSVGKTIYPVESIDVAAILHKLLFPPKVNWGGPARPRILSWTAKIQSNPEDLAEAISALSTKPPPSKKGKGSTERKLLHDAIPLLKDLLVAVAPSKQQQEALSMLQALEDAYVH